MKTRHQFTRRDLIKFARTAAIGLPATSVIAVGAKRQQEISRIARQVARSLFQTVFIGASQRHPTGSRVRETRMARACVSGIQTVRVYDSDRIMFLRAYLAKDECVVLQRDHKTKRRSMR
jgi:hypothetical protein